MFVQERGHNRPYIVFLSSRPSLITMQNMVLFLIPCVSTPVQKIGDAGAPPPLYGSMVDHPETCPHVVVTIPSMVTLNRITQVGVPTNLGDIKNYKCHSLCMQTAVVSTVKTAETSSHLK